MRLGYADPPYPGCAKRYADQPDYAGEVDHVALADRLREFDGYVLHTSAPAFAQIAALVPEARAHIWIKPFAAFKRNVSVAYAWEPVFIVPVRKPVVRPALRNQNIISRDWFAESITLKRGLTGAKPQRLCWWIFACAGMGPGDELVDLFPGTGAVSRAWESYRDLFREEETMTP